MRPVLARQLDRPPTGVPERRADERVGRQVEQVAGEPAGLEVGRPELVGGAPIGDEGAFAADHHDDPDPARGPARDPRRPDGDLVGPECFDERPADRVATDRRHERRAGAEPRQPPGRVRSGTALAQRDPSRHVRPALQRPRRRHDDVEHQVAEDRHLRRVLAAAPRKARRKTPHGSGHGGRIASGRSALIARLAACPSLRRLARRSAPARAPSAASRRACSRRSPGAPPRHAAAGRRHGPRPSPEPPPPDPQPRPHLRRCKDRARSLGRPRHVLPAPPDHHVHPGVERRAGRPPGLPTRRARR